MTRKTSLEQLLDDRFEHPEGLLWDARDARLLWVDVFQGAVLLFDPAGGELTRFEIGQPVGFVAPRAAGGFLCGVRDGFGVLSTGGQFDLRCSVISEEHDLQMNDGAVDPAGRAWAGTLALAAGAVGNLFCLTPDWVAAPVLADVTVSNGIGWSPDGRRCYYIDTTLGRIDVFDFDVDDGVLTNRRILAHVDRSPDGLAVDADGGVWVAQYDGGEVRRYDPSGRLDRTIRLPSRHVTTCAFGGPGMRTLFVSVSRRELDDATAMKTRAGHIFAVDVGIAGAPTNEFAG